MKSTKLISFTLILALIIAFSAEVKSQEIVGVSIVFENYDARESNIDSLFFWIDDLFSREQNQFVIKKSEITEGDGSINHFVYLHQPSYLEFGFNNKAYYALAYPGDTLSIFINEKNAENPIRFEGNNSDFNNIHNRFYSELDEHLIVKSPENVLNYKSDSGDIEQDNKVYAESLFRSLEFLESFVDKNKLDQIDFERIKAKLNYLTAVKLIASEKVNNQTDNFENIFTLFPIDNSEASLSAVNLFYLREYYNFYRGLNYGKQEDFLPSGEEIASMILEFNKDLTENESSTLLKFSSQTPKEFDFYKSDTIHFQEIVGKNGELFQEKFPPKHPLIEYILSETEGFCRDIFLSWTFNDFMSSDYLEVVDVYINTYVSVVENEAFKNKVVGLYSEKKNEIYPNTGESIEHINFREIPKTDDSSFFSEILANYVGKVIYIDFWGTWCAPCLAEMPSSRKLKEELNNQNIVFIYFGVSSEDSKWRKAAYKYGIQGEHYLLKGDEFQLLSEEFQIQTIPRYMIVDKVGSVFDKDAMRPSSTELKDTIIGLLEK